MSVDLTTKVLCLKASAHFLIISNLYFLLTIVITAATLYAYFYCPKDLFGIPMAEEQLNQIKDDGIMKGIGGITIIPFFVLSFLSGFMSCFKNKHWFGLCCIVSAILAFIFLIYDGYVLMYLKLKYVWPPQALSEVQVPVPPGQPFTTEDQLVNFTKVLISAITFCMFAVVSILLYCTFLLANLSFLYKSPEPIPRRRRPVKRRELEEEDEETGGDENETDEKDKSQKNEDGKEKSKKIKEEKKKKKEETGTDDQGTGTGTQTGTGMDW